MVYHIDVPRTLLLLCVCLMWCLFVVCLCAWWSSLFVLVPQDEYHPKHNTIYCWRARRLMATAKLSAFEGMAEGSVLKVCSSARADAMT